MAVWKALIPVSGACFISYLISKWKYAQQKYHFLKLIPLIPAWIALLMKLRPGSFIDRSFVAIGHCLYHAGIASLFCKWIPLEYGVLIVYLPLPLVFHRSMFGLKEIATHHDIFYKYYIQLFWSLPIISSMKLLSNIYRISPMDDIYLNHGIQSPSISIINDDICLGRIPFNQRDVEIMRNEPFNITAVINMCIESNGPINEYNKYGIKYLNIPLLDTLPPKLSDIEKAIKFIQEFVLNKDNAISELEMENNKRVLIHCRGGRSRSASIALCWLIFDTNMSIKEAMQLLMTKRKAVHPKIQYYQVVHQYCVSKGISGSEPGHKRLLSFHLMD